MINNLYYVNCSRSENAFRLAIYINLEKLLLLTEYIVLPSGLHYNSNS